MGKNRRYRKIGKIEHFWIYVKNRQKQGILPKQAKMGKNGYFGEMAYFGNSANYDKHTRHVQYNKIIKNMNHYITYL